jgi:hypothetical protein
VDLAEAPLLRGARAARETPGPVKEDVMAITLPTDEELNTLILARLATIGIDITTLPLSDSSAPADQTRVLSSLRNFIRNSSPQISQYVLDVQENPPVEYPAQLTAWSVG